MSELKPHQERVVDKQTGTIAWHSLGSGKTLTGLKRAEKRVKETGRPAVFVVPAPLVSNIYKERDKHSIDIPDDKLHVYSYQKIAQDGMLERVLAFKPSFVGVDEAHRIRNPGKAAQVVRELMSSVDDTLALTGTPIYNNHTDIAPLVNSVSKGDSVLPLSPALFNEKYLQKEIVRASLWNKIVHDMKDGERYTLKNENALQKILKDRIDYHRADSSDFPEAIEEEVQVPLSDEQLAIYHHLMGKLPRSLRKKVEEGLPPSKQEMQKMTAFLTGPRMISNSTASFDTKNEPVSSKIDRSTDILMEAKEEDPNFKALVYSHYLESGIDPAVKSMQEKGLKVGVFTGSTSRLAKDALVKGINDGDLDVLAVSSSGTEGLDLKGIKHIHVLDPHFNDNKIRQVIGRGIRYKSHEHLPEEERKVHVRRFISTMPDKKYLGGLLKVDGGVSADEYLRDRSQEKMMIQDRIEHLVKAAAKTLKEIDEDKAIANKRAKAAPFVGAGVGLVANTTRNLTKAEGIGTAVNLKTRKVEDYIKRPIQKVSPKNPKESARVIGKAALKNARNAAVAGAAIGGVAGAVNKYVVHEKARKEAKERRSELTKRAEEKLPRQEKARETAHRWGKNWGVAGGAVGAAGTLGVHKLNKALDSPLRGRDVAKIGVRKIGKGMAAGYATGALMGAIRNKLGPAREKMSK